MNNDNTDYVSNESGRFRDYLNYLSMGPVRTELIAGMTTF